jgi:hypothetical protein
MKLEECTKYIASERLPTTPAPGAEEASMVDNAPCLIWIIKALGVESPGTADGSNVEGGMKCT